MEVEVATAVTAAAVAEVASEEFNMEAEVEEGSKGELEEATLSGEDACVNPLPAPPALPCKPEVTLDEPEDNLREVGLSEDRVEPISFPRSTRSFPGLFLLVLSSSSSSVLSFLFFFGINLFLMAATAPLTADFFARCSPFSPFPSPFLLCLSFFLLLPSTPFSLAWKPRGTGVLPAEVITTFESDSLETFVAWGERSSSGIEAPVCC